MNCVLSRSTTPFLSSFMCPLNERGKSGSENLKRNKIEAHAYFTPNPKEIKH